MELSGLCATMSFTGRHVTSSLVPICRKSGFTPIRRSNRLCYTRRLGSGHEMRLHGRQNIHVVYRCTTVSDAGDVIGNNTENI